MAAPDQVWGWHWVHAERVAMRRLYFDVSEDEKSRAKRERKRVCMGIEGCKSVGIITTM